MKDTASSVSRNCLLSGHIGLLVVSVVVAGLLVFVGCSGDVGLGDVREGEVEEGEVREVSVMEAELSAPDRLTLIVGSCNKDPEVSLLRETDTEVRVKVTAFFSPSLVVDDCLDIVEVRLQEPLGDRVLVDEHTGQLVPVSTIGSPYSKPEQGANEQPLAEREPPEIDDPPSDAELSDLQAVADQKGMSLQEAIDRYAWNDNFGLAVMGIRRAFPEDFTGSEIADANHAWVGFAGAAPEGVGDMIERFTSSHSGVSVEVRTNLGFTETEKKRGLEAVHFAIREAPEVIDVVTYFDFETRQIRTTVLLDRKVSDSVLEDLRAIAMKRLSGAIRPDVLDIFTVSVVRAEGPLLSGDE